MISSPAISIAAVSLDGASSAANKVQDDGDHRKNEKYVDQKAGDMEEGETTEPEDDQNDCENKKHSAFFLKLTSCVPSACAAAIRPAETSSL